MIAKRFRAACPAGVAREEDFDCAIANRLEDFSSAPCDGTPAGSERWGTQVTALALDDVPDAIHRAAEDMAEADRHCPKDQLGRQSASRS